MLRFLGIEIDFPSVGPIGDFCEISTENICGFKGATGRTYKGAIISKNIRFAFQIGNNIINIDQKQQWTKPAGYPLPDAFRN